MNLRIKLNLIMGVIVIFTVGLSSSCCTDKFCFGAQDIGEIKLLNFSKSELDSTFLVFYEKDSDFEIVEDSLMVQILGSSDSLQFFVQSSRKISVNYDYRLYFTVIGREYEISGFRTIKTECNEGCFPRKDYYHRIEGYEINGNYKESSLLEIDQLNN